MRQKLNEMVTVSSQFLEEKKRWLVKETIWNNRQYNIEKTGMYYPEKRGVKIYHIFYVCSRELCFKLELEAESLIWRLVEISDGLPE